jgi:transcriptional regulator with XRE-family HTH domain
VHTSTPPPVPPSPVLTGLGQALRWLRERQARKQYRVADDAGVTKGMLSAYETGRQRPSLETLGKLLETLGCDLNDLHNALQIVNGRPERMKGWQLRDAAPNLPHLPDLQQAESGLNERAAGHAPGHPGVRELGRPAPRQGPGYAAMPAFGFLAQLPGGRAGALLAGEVREGGRGRPTSELYRLLGLAGDDQAPLTSLPELPELPEEEELALAQMLEGFHNLLRYWHRCLTSLSPRDPHGPHEPHEAAKGLSRPGGTSAPAAPASEADEGGGLPGPSPPAPATPTPRPRDGRGN